MDGLNANYKIIEAKADDDDNEFDEKDILDCQDKRQDRPRTPLEGESTESKDIVPPKVYRLVQIEDDDSVENELFENYLTGSKDDDYSLNVAMTKALHQQNLDYVKTLLKWGIKIRPIDSSGRTFVHEAYFNTEVPENADLLLNYCDEVNYGDVTGVTHLHIACAIGNINAVRRYLADRELQVDLCCGVDFWQPVHAAASGFNKEILKLLVNRGADPFSPLAETDQTPWTIVLRTKAWPLGIRRESKLGTIEFFLDYAKRREGFDPIYDICLECRESTDFLREAVANCVRNGFDDFARLDRSGRTILHALAERAEENESYVAVAKMLLENFRLDVDVKNSGGQTPLDVAVHNLNMDMTRLLIRHGADPAFVTLHWQEFNFQKIERSPLSMYRDIWNTVRVLVSAGFHMDWEKFLQIYIIIRAFIEHVSIGQRNRITKTLQYGEIELFQNAYDKVYKDSSEKDEHQMRKNLLFDLCEYQNIVEIGKMNTANGIPIKKFILLKVESLREELGIGDKSVDLNPYKLEINEMAKTPINDKGETLLDICQFDSFQTFKLLQAANTDLLFRKTDSLPLIGELVKSYVFKAYVRGYCISVGANFMTRFWKIPKNISEKILDYMNNEQIMHYVSENWKHVESKAKTQPLANACDIIPLSGKGKKYFQCCSIL
ncbi:uncharacterized protein LOC106650063 [Trichogramma pretiosum]|uniref:uncharacterized protein LOC106650063 n=1 Tax=Trichogramma pretiosum TaxID=7493 RepID=UPI0006C9D9BF|nr:uncharacterized protein LOC106650063 [Trichogramma pretiosum]